MGISDRIREERQRLGLSQEQLGAIAGVRKQAQLTYEKGDRHPDTLYLAAIAETGADVLYILTGQRNQSMLTADEQQLLALFRAASLPVKMAAVGALQGGSTRPKPLNKVVVKAPHGNAAGRDLLITDTTKGDVDGKQFESDKPKRTGRRS